MIVKELIVRVKIAGFVFALSNIPLALLLKELTCIYGSIRNQKICIL